MSLHPDPDQSVPDDTAAVAHGLGVRVVRPPRNTGSKAGAHVAFPLGM